MRLLLALLLLAPAFGQGRTGSIYDASARPIRMGTTNTARQAGDLVTVVIMETSDLKREETSNLQKATGMDYELGNFDLAPNAFSTLPQFRGDRTSTFNGTANYEKKGQFTARLTAIVVDTLPGGNLVIQGRREIRIDNEVKVIEISGVIRRYDIRGDNTVLSEAVADARISYAGTGPMTNTTNRRGFGAWLHDVLDWLWPF